MKPAVRGHAPSSRSTRTPMAQTRRFPSDATSVTDARRFVRRALVGSPVDAETVELLTSELAANAVVHARTEFEVRVHRLPDLVRVEVVNDRPEMVVAIREPDEHGG